ncbi:MAG: glycosyltransferase [Chitinophagaceae bacterium]|nr:MAG: glycosyltransferase [Chitinophagaceae bacterium]
MPTVSVVMPVYNASEFLREAIDSIVEQTFTNWELIIVEDCSTDDSAAIVRQYTDPRIKAHFRAQNGGVVAAMNDGLRQASGEFIAVMHADDVSKRERLQLEVEWLQQHPEHAVVAGFIEKIDTRGNNCGIWNLDRRVIDSAHIRRHMLRENCIAHSSVLMRGSVVKKYGYDSGQQKAGFAVEDYALWLEMLSDGYEFGKVPEVLLRYRIHSQSATSKYLRRNNPFFINYQTKRLYLDQIISKRPLNRFDKKLQRSMYVDYLLARGKEIKAKMFRR